MGNKPKPTYDNPISYLNKQSEMYHKALKSASKDLCFVFCLDLWPEPVIMTEEALRALYVRVGGRYTITDSAIDPIMAAQVSDTVLVLEDIAILVIK